MVERCFVLNVKEVKMNKIQKQLHFSCSHCSATFQLLEIHQKENLNCPADCLTHWQTLLNQHYQEHIILNLAQQESHKEEHNE
jgi:hypothetical protein